MCGCVCQFFGDLHLFISNERLCDGHKHKERQIFFSIYPSICLCICPSPNTFPSSSFTGIISFFVYLLNPLPPHLSFLPPPHRWCPSCVAPPCRSCCCCQSQSSGPRSSCWCSASRSRYSTPSHPHHLATSCSSHGNRKEAKGERKREGRRGL